MRQPNAWAVHLCEATSSAVAPRARPLTACMTALALSFPSSPHARGVPVPMPVRASGSALLAPKGAVRDASCFTAATS